MKSKLLIVATLAVGIHSVHALNITWANIASNTSWSTGTSWIGGNAPTNSLTTDVAIFTSVSNAQPNLAAITRSVNGIDFQLPAGGAIFTSDAGAILRLGGTGIDATTQLSGTSTVSVESIQINGAETWTLFSSTSNSSTSTFSVSSNIDLNGLGLTVVSNRNSAAGNVGIVNLSGVISGSANLSLSSPGASRNTINLTGNSSYSGTTTITGVAVTANSLANDTVNSALGSSGTVILGSSAAFARLTFQNLSADGGTDRPLSLKGTATGAYTLANNDAASTIAFTNPGNTGDTSVSTVNNLIFALGGTNTGNNTFGQVINDRIGGGLTILRKVDAGTWVVTNSNSYTGGTELNAGKLLIAQGSSLGTAGVTLTGSATLGATTALTLSNNINLDTFTATFNNTSNITSEVFDVTGLITGTGAVIAQTISSTTKGSIRFSNDANSYSGSFTGLSGTYQFTSVADAGTNSSLGAGSSVILGNNSGSVVFQYVGSANGSTTRPLNWGTTTGSLNLDSNGTGTVSFLNTGNLRSGLGNATLQLRGTNTGDNTLAQAINDSTGVTSVIKAGLGKWILTGANNYSGNTTVSTGTLSLTIANLADASSVSIASGAVLNLGFAGTDTIKTLFLNGSQVAAGVYGATGSAGVTVIDNTHFTGTGSLTVTTSPVSGNYASWATAKGIPGEPSTGDFDADGLSNGVEYALGLIPTASSVPAQTFTGGTVTFTKGADAITNGDVTWIIQQSFDLQDWTDEFTQPAGDPSPTISRTLPTGATKVFTRLKVVISGS